jgi:hypothetical protein
MAKKEERERKKERKKDRAVGGRTIFRMGRRLECKMVVETPPALQKCSRLKNPALRVVRLCFTTVRVADCCPKRAVNVQTLRDSPKALAEKLGDCDCVCSW